MRVPAFVCGGYTSRQLASNGKTPYVSDALMHVTDVFAMTVGLGCIDGSQNCDSALEDIDGIDQVHECVFGVLVMLESGRFNDLHVKSRV